MAQILHDIMISSIENEVDAEYNLWNVLLPLERELQVDIEFLNVHPSGPNIRTTYAFLRFADPSVHPEIVRRLNGRLHRGRYLHVRINPLPKPEHRLNSRHSPRIQVELIRLARKEREWLEEKATLKRQLRASNDRVERFVNVEAQLREEIHRLENEPLNIEINSIQTEVQQLQKSLAHCRTESSKAVLNRSRPLKAMIEAGERKLTTLQNELQAKQQRLFDLNNGLEELRGEIGTLQGLIGDLTCERERLIEQNQVLERQNQELESQLQTLRQQFTEQGQVINNLQTENEALRQSQLQSAVSVVHCPVCYEASTERQMMVLFCGHVLCEPCRHKINRGRVDRHCPTCRRGDLTIYLELFL